MNEELFYGLIAAGIAILTVERLAARHRRRSGGLEGLSTSAVSRTAKVGALSSKLSWRYLWAKVRGAFASEEKRAKIQDETHIKSAEQVVRFMGNMKGALMKLGQMMSFVSQDLPPQYRQILAQLQTQSPPMRFDLARQVIEEELGGSLKEKFSDVDPEPLAAASIGQVHRARLKDGTDVVVKVQYPGVDRAIRADLSNLDWLYGMMGMLNPGLDPKPLVRELKERLTEELDYLNEAKNQQQFVDLYGGHPFIRIPEVVHSHTGKRVLTQRFVEGRPFAWVLKQPRDLQQKVSEVLYRFVFGSIRRFRVFNGDPHPGNYIFHDDGAVTFLDFGCTKYFDDRLIENWGALIRSHLDGDLETFRRKLVEMKFISEKATGSKELLHEYFGYFYEPFRADREFTFTPEYNAASFQMIFDRSHPEYAGLIKEFNMPPDFALVNRIQWGVYSILSELHATGNWHRIHREYYFGDPPSTKMGEQSAAFRGEWKRLRGIPESALVWMEPTGLQWEGKEAAA